MFKGYRTIIIENELNQEQLKDKLMNLGNVLLSEGSFQVNIETDLSSFFHDFNCNCSYSVKEGKTIIRLRYNSSPGVISWILGICFFPLGFLIFILPINSKNEFESRVRYLQFA